MAKTQIRRIVRPQFRAPDDIQVALARYCEDNFRTPSQVLTLALRSFIPAEYFAKARQVAKERV